MKRVIKASTDNVYYWNGIDEVPYDVVNVVIEGSVTSIGNYTFEDRTGLTSIIIPDSITSIGWHAFSGCTGLKSVTIGNSVTSIGYSAFSNCASLTSIAIPNSVADILDSAFSGCTGLTSVTIPDGVMYIGSDAFSGCTGLTSITIPDNVTSIGSSAFYGCESLASVNIPGGITRIHEYTFCSCTSLTSIVLPASVEYVGAYAFYGCRNLIDVTILSDPDYFEMGKDAFDWKYLNMKTIKAAPEIKQLIAEMSKPSKHTSYSAILSMLDEDLDKYSDPLYEDTEAGSYITGLCQEAEGQLGIWLEPSIQGGHGSIWIHDSNNNILAENIDFESFDSDVINIAFRSKSPSDFKRKYTSYLKRLLK